jgi:hypothetical protein
MTDEDRFLGRIEEFIEWEKKEHSWLRSEIESLREWKWKITGGAACVAVIINFIVEHIK